MTQKQLSEEQQKELSWDEAVTRHLEDHPDFFTRNPKVLAKLKLVHPVTGRTISLIERQVQVLRQEKQALEQQLQELVAIARENDLLAARLHRFALAMADSASLDDVFDNAYEMLRREFKLSAVTMLCQGEAKAPFSRNEFVGDDSRLGNVLRQVGAGKPVCGAKLEESLMKYLFGERAAEIKSCALIALDGNTRRGVLCLGSQDPRRFHSSMGTIYLTKIGDIIMHSITRFT